MNLTCGFCPQPLGSRVVTLFNVGKGTNFFWLVQTGRWVGVGWELVPIN